MSIVHTEAEKKAMKKSQDFIEEINAARVGSPIMTFLLTGLAALSFREPSTGFLSHIGHSLVRSTIGFDWLSSGLGPSRPLTEGAHAVGNALIATDVPAMAVVGSLLAFLTVSGVVSTVMAFSPAAARERAKNVQTLSDIRSGVRRVPDTVKKSSVSRPMAGTTSF